MSYITIFENRGIRNLLNNLFLGRATLVSSLFFIMGAFVVYQIIFTGIKKVCAYLHINFDTYALRTIIGITYILGLLFSLQMAIPNRNLSWTAVNFQLVAVIFYTAILSVPSKYHLFTPIVLAFMIFNSVLTSWASWGMAIDLILFYKTLNYIRDHMKGKFPFMQYFLSSLFFGAIYWIFIMMKFNISFNTLLQEIFYLAVLELFTFGYIGILFTDLELRAALFRDATHDKLTSAYNYDAFDIDFRKLFQKDSRNHIKFTMMMFDVDRFKKINDTYGHLAGDKVLQNVVKVVQEVIDENDRNIKLYRTGGEEFNVIFPDYKLNDTENIVREIFETVNHSTTEYNNNTIHLTISMGVSEISDSDVSINDFYSRVDEALYHSKRGGRREITVI